MNNIILYILSIPRKNQISTVYFVFFVTEVATAIVDESGGIWGWDFAALLGF